MNQYFDIVIIGNSAAGLQAIRTIRRQSSQVSVAMIDREDCPAYSRVHTPYFAGGKTAKHNLFIVDRSFYVTMGVTTLLGQAAERIDPDRHEVLLTDGSRVRFGKLLLAAGGEARPLAGGEQRRICTLRHLADAEKLKVLLRTAKSVTALGAGLVSVPVLSHLPPGVERHLVVGSDRIFSRVIDAESAALLEEHFIHAGVTVHKKDDIVDVREGERLSLTLASGKQIESDVLVVGKGVTPNTQLASEAGLAVGDGILIDDCCRSGHPDIYAAGDAAEGKDFVTGKLTIQGNWMTAVEQGENAALNMLGLACAYEGSIKNNSTEVFGLDVAVTGYCQDDAPGTVSSGNRFTRRFRKVFLDEKGRMIGASLIGETNDAGVYYQLVRTRAQFPGKQLLQGENRYAACMQRMA
jgi:NAD(P)H-nitrite reductase large subunit